MLNRKIQEAYQGIVAEESLKNNTKQWIQQERIRREQKHKPRPVLKLVAAISVFILLLGSGGAGFILPQQRILPLISIPRLSFLLTV